MKEDFGLKCDCGGKLIAKPYVTKEKAIEAVKEKDVKEEDKGVWVLGLTLMGLMTPPHFVCEKCGISRGYYDTIGRALLQVDPLPQGAYACYDLGKPQTKNIKKVKNLKKKSK